MIDFLFVKIDQHHKLRMWVGQWEEFAEVYIFFLSELVKGDQVVKNGQKWPKTAKSGQKRTKSGINGPSCSKFVKVGPSWSMGYLVQVGPGWSKLASGYVFFCEKLPTAR